MTLTRQKSQRLTTTENADQRPFVADTTSRTPFGSRNNTVLANNNDHKGKENNSKATTTTAAAAVIKQSATTISSSSTTSSSSSTNTKKLLVPSIAVGIRCAVRYNIEGDFFGKHRKSDNLHPCTIIKVEKRKKTVKVQFLDSTTDTVNYNEIITLVTEDSIDYYYNEKGEKVIAFDQNPKNLELGDLVYAYYQNGHGSDVKKNVWYRGRIVGVQRSDDNTFRVCDVAYDDEELEINIPFACINASNIILVEKGKDNPIWLVGLEFTIQLNQLVKKTKELNSYKGNTRNHQQLVTGIIQKPDNNNTNNSNTIPVKFHFHGKDIIIKFPYKTLVNSVIDNARTNNKHIKELEWPFPFFEVVKETNNDHKKPSKSPKKRTRSQSPSSKKRTKSRSRSPLSKKRSKSRSRSPPKKRTNTIVKNETKITTIAVKNEVCNDTKKRNTSTKQETQNKIKVDESKKVVGNARKPPTRTSKRISNNNNNNKQESKKELYNDEAFDDNGCNDSDTEEEYGKTNARTRRSTKPTKSGSTAQTTSKNENAIVSNEKTKSNNAVRKTTNSRSTRKTTAKKGRYNKQDIIAIVEEESFSKLQIDPDIPQPKRTIKTLESMIANPLGKALASCDTLLASNLLHFLLKTHDRVPGDDLWKMLIQLNTYGPISDGTKFPDITKMDLCLQYMQKLFNTHGMLDVCIDHIEQRFARNNKQCTYSDTFFNQMISSQYYMTDNDGDENSITSPHAVNRVIASLHAKVCFAQVFQTIIAHLVKPLIVQGQNNNGKSNNDCLSFDNLPLLSDIVSSRRGVKDALEQSVKACMLIWTNLGHFAIGDWSTFDTNDSCILQDRLVFGQKYIFQLSSSLVSITSYLAWLYSKEANEDVDALADIIGNVIYLSFEDAELEKRLSFGDVDGFIIQVKLTFICDLLKDVIPQLRPKLAERLGVATEYNILFG